MCARPRPMSPYAYDYGAGGALFDIVNVQIWTRRQARRTHKVASIPGAAPRSFVNFPRAGLAHRAEHSPCKREAGGSSPPASTTVNGRNRPVEGHRFGKAETGVRSAVAAPSCTRGETVDAAASEAAAAKAWRFKSSRVHQHSLASPSGQGIGPTHRHPQVRVLERAPHPLRWLSGQSTCATCRGPAVRIRDEAPSSLP